MSSTTSTYFYALTIRKHLLNLSGRGPSICYRRPFCRLKAPLGLSLLRGASQTRSMRFERSGRGQEPSRGHKFSILENLVFRRDFTSQTLSSFPSDLVGVALVGATPLHLLSQTALPLKSPTGAFIAAQTRAAPNAFSPEGPKPADAVKSLLLLAFTAPCVKKQNWNDRSRSNSAKIKINFPLNMARACGGHFKSSNCTLNRRYPRHAAH